MAKIVEPVVFPIIPASGGKNTSKPPQAIDMKESPELMNVRIHHGQITTRDGFKSKYYGGWEPILHIDVGYSSDGTTSNLIAFGLTRLWQSQSSGPMIPIHIYDTAGALMDLDTDQESMVYSVDIGQGTYDCKTINGPGMFPAAGFGNILVFTNQNDGVFVVITASDGAPLIAEEIHDVGGVGLLGARAVMIFDNRILVGGSTNNAAEVLWSVAGEFEEFDPAADPSAGARLLGDGADWIQAMARMGEFAIVYKERSIHVGRKSFKTDPAIEFEPAPGQGIGLAAPLSIGDLGEEHIFLGWDDVYVFSLKAIDSIGERIQDELFGRLGNLGILPEYVKKCIGTIAEEFNEYWLFVPTGRFPECENVLGRGTMDFCHFTGDTHTNTTVDDIAAADWARIKIGDTITGADIPADTVVMSKTAPATITISNAATGSTNDIALETGNDDDWALVADGDGSLDEADEGNFGLMAQKITRSTGTYVSLRASGIDMGSLLGAGKIISVVVWLKTTTATYDMDVIVTEQDNGDVDGTSHTLALTSQAVHDYTAIVYSFTSADADFQHIKVEIKGKTASTIYYIDAVQVTDITDLDVTQVYTDTDSGYQAPGVEDPDGVVQMIPFIADKCGPWVCDTVWVFNYVANAWTCWRLPLTGFGYDVLSTTLTIADLEGTIAEQTWRFDDKLLEAFAPTNLLGEVDGQIYESSGAWGTDFQGLMSRAVLCWWESKDFDLGRPHLDKTFSRLIIHHEVSHFPTEITVSISTDSGNSWEEQTVTIRTGHTETFADFFVTGPQGRFKVRADANGVRINGFTIKIVPRGETNALDV